MVIDDAAPRAGVMTASRPGSRHERNDRATRHANHPGDLRAHRQIVPRTNRSPRKTNPMVSCAGCRQDGRSPNEPNSGGRDNLLSRSRSDKRSVQGGSRAAGGASPGPLVAAPPGQQVVRATPGGICDSRSWVQTCRPGPFSEEPDGKLCGLSSVLAVPRTNRSPRANEPDGKLCGLSPGMAVPRTNRSRAPNEPDGKLCGLSPGWPFPERTEARAKRTRW